MSHLISKIKKNIFHSQARQQPLVRRGRLAQLHGQSTLGFQRREEKKIFQTYRSSGRNSTVLFASYLKTDRSDTGGPLKNHPKIPLSAGNDRDGTRYSPSSCWLLTPRLCVWVPPTRRWEHLFLPNPARDPFFVPTFFFPSPRGRPIAAGSSLRANETFHERTAAMIIIIIGHQWWSVENEFIFSFAGGGVCECVLFGIGNRFLKISTHHQHRKLWVLKITFNQVGTVVQDRRD